MTNEQRRMIESESKRLASYQKSFNWHDTYTKNYPRMRELLEQIEYSEYKIRCWQAGIVPEARS